MNHDPRTSTWIFVSLIGKLWIWPLPFWTRAVLVTKGNTDLWIQCCLWSCSVCWWCLKHWGDLRCEWFQEPLRLKACLEPIHWFPLKEDWFRAMSPWQWALDWANAGDGGKNRYLSPHFSAARSGPWSSCRWSGNHHRAQPLQPMQSLQVRQPCKMRIQACTTWRHSLGTPQKQTQWDTVSSQAVSGKPPKVLQREAPDRQLTFRRLPPERGAEFQNPRTYIFPVVSLHFDITQVESEASPYWLGGRFVSLLGRLRGIMARASCDSFFRAGLPLVICFGGVLPIIFTVHGNNLEKKNLHEVLLTIMFLASRN